MQDIARVKATGDELSQVGFSPSVYQPVPYALPESASANAPTARVIPWATRTLRPTIPLRPTTGATLEGPSRRGNSGVNDTDPKDAAVQGA